MSPCSRGMPRATCLGLFATSLVGGALGAIAPQLHAAPMCSDVTSACGAIPRLSDASGPTPAHAPSLWGWKVALAFVIGLEGYLGGLLPTLFPALWTPRGRDALSFLALVSGGIFFGTAMLHLVPEMVALQSSLNGASQYPLGSLMALVGFSLVFAIEHVVFGDGHDDGDLAAAAKRGAGAVSAADEASVEPILAGHAREGGWEQAEGVRKGGLEAGSMGIEPGTGKGWGEGSVGEAAHGHGHGHAHPHAHTHGHAHAHAHEHGWAREHVHGGDSWGVDGAGVARRQSSGDAGPATGTWGGGSVLGGPLSGAPRLRQVLVRRRNAVVLLAALVVHSALEGVALGVTQSTRDLWGIAVAILSHKLVSDSLAVGIRFIAHGASRAEVALWLIPVALSSPLGIAVGMAASGVSDAASMLLMGASAGTYLYVGAFEVLAHEMSHLPHPTCQESVSQTVVAVDAAAGGAAPCPGGPVVGRGHGSSRRAKARMLLAFVLGWGAMAALSVFSE